MKPPCPICYDEPEWWCWLAHQQGWQLLAMWLIGALAVVWICNWPKNENIAVGYYAGVNLTEGSHNIFLGPGSGRYIATGNYQMEISIDGEHAWRWKLSWWEQLVMHYTLRHILTRTPVEITYPKLLTDAKDSQ